VITDPTILVPIDLSDCSADVVRIAAEQAARGKAALLLLHVIETPIGLGAETRVHPRGGEPISVFAHLRREAQDRIVELAKLATALGATAAWRIEEGQAADVIASVAREASVQRIVMGTHGRRGLSRWMLGSVAESVRERVTCAVETIQTERKAHCEARSCSWCATHRSQAIRDVQAELDG